MLSKYFCVKPVELKFKLNRFVYQNRLQSSKWLNIIMIHGMLGSKELYGTGHMINPLCNSIQNELNTNILCYSIDMRNHGDSPHDNISTLESMCVDLEYFMNLYSINNPILIGHSMGGKVSLLYSLLKPETINGVISIDASPAIYDHSHQNIFDAMKSISFNNEYKFKYEIDKILKQSGINDGSERAFIMNNLNSNLNGWRSNVNIINDYEWSIMGFPEYDIMKKYTKLSLFIGGNESTRLTQPNYIKPLNYWFPNNDLILYTGGDHFVHNTHTKEFIRDVTSYLTKLEI
mmetsp:Transcript_11456/g.14350  ORF Transcript_11456/g.14350 Transcript_11456/m.14350 type:complete len:290 (-) Transcript_11456:30-899(-)